MGTVDRARPAGGDSLAQRRKGAKIFGNEVLTEVDAGSATSLGGLFVSSNPALPTFNLGAVESVDGNLIISSNPSLSNFNLVSLTTVGGDFFRVVQNAVLPNCLAQALLGRVRAGEFNGEEEISGNDEGATCDNICNPVGSSDDGGNVCQPDGTFAVVCNTETCLTENRMCQNDTDNSRFNQCSSPDSITGTCAAAGEIDDGRSGEGPVILNASYTANAAQDAACEAVSAGTLAWEASFDYRDTEENAHAADGEGVVAAFLWIRASAGEEDPVSPMMPDLPLIFAEGAAGNQGRVTMTLCSADPPAEIAVQIQDSAGNRSNRLCLAR